MSYRDEITIPAFELLRRLDLLRKSTDMLAGAWVSWITGGATDTELDKALSDVNGNVRELQATYAQYTDMHKSRRLSTRARYLKDAEPKKKRPHAIGCKYCKGKGYVWRLSALSPTIHGDNNPHWYGCTHCRGTGVQNFAEFKDHLSDMIKKSPNIPYTDMPDAEKRHYISQVPSDKARASGDEFVKVLKIGLSADTSGLRASVGKAEVALAKLAMLAAATPFSLEEYIDMMINGAKGGKTEMIRLAMQAQVAKRHDPGLTEANSQPCPDCKGYGYKTTVDGIAAWICKTCNGASRVPRPDDQPPATEPLKTCPVCKGSGINTVAEGFTTGPSGVQDCYFCKGKKVVAYTFDATTKIARNGEGNTAWLINGDIFAHYQAATVDATGPQDTKPSTLQYCATCGGTGRLENLRTGFAATCGFCKGTGKRDQH